MDFFKRANELRSETVAHRRTMHARAEAGMETPMTREYLMSSLRALGIVPRLCGCSVVGEIGQGEPLVLLRADTDALPMKEESGEEFASRTESAHTCGHDLHAAMLLSAARMLKEAESSLPGRVRLLFQPGEETLSGAMDAIAHGVLESPVPIAALALHVTAGATPPGQGYYNATRSLMRSADRFRIELRGKGGHAAYPDRTCDPIAAAVAMHEALSRLVSRELGPGNEAVLSVCSIRGGHAANVIPDQACLEGAMHAGDERTRRHLLRRMEQLIPHIASACRVQGRLILTAPTPPLLCDREITDICLAANAALPLTMHPDMQAGASEDFAHIASRIPSAYFYLSAGGCSEAVAHHPAVRFDEAVLPMGGAFLANSALALLEAARGGNKSEK